METAAFHGLAGIVLRSASTKLLIAIDLICYTSNIVELEFGREACLHLEVTSLNARSKTTMANGEDVTFAVSESSQRIAISLDLTRFRAKMAFSIDPAGGSLVRYARGQALSKMPEIAS